jgi:hypothetical protein
MMGRVAQVDPDQLAALRRLRAAFGFVLILKVRELCAGPTPSLLPVDGLPGTPPAANDGTGYLP